METDDNGSINKTLHPNPKEGRTVEEGTSVKLEQVEEDPSKFEIKSILVVAWIFSDLSWASVFENVWGRIFNCTFLEMYNEPPAFPKILEAYWILLETIRRFDRQEKYLLNVITMVVEKLIQG